MAEETRDVIKTLSLEVFPYPPYSKHVTPSVYYCFWPWINTFGNSNYATETMSLLSKGCNTIFELWKRDILKKGVSKLVFRWEHVIGANSDYFVFNTFERCFYVWWNLQKLSWLPGKWFEKMFTSATFNYSL